MLSRITQNSLRVTMMAYLTADVGQAGLSTALCCYILIRRYTRQRSIDPSQALVLRMALQSTPDLHIQRDQFLLYVSSSGDMQLLQRPRIPMWTSA